MLTLRLKDSVAPQWAAKLNERMAILRGARQNWFAACAGAARMSKARHRLLVPEDSYYSESASSSFEMSLGNT